MNVKNFLSPIFYSMGFDVCNDKLPKTKELIKSKHNSYEVSKLSINMYI